MSLRCSSLDLCSKQAALWVSFREAPCCDKGEKMPWARHTTKAIVRPCSQGLLQPFMYRTKTRIGTRCASLLRSVGGSSFFRLSLSFASLRSSTPAADLSYSFFDHHHSLFFCLSNIHSSINCYISPAFLKHTFVAQIAAPFPCGSRDLPRSNPIVSTVQHNTEDHEILQRNTYCPFPCRLHCGRPATAR